MYVLVKCIFKTSIFLFIVDLITSAPTIVQGDSQSKSILLLWTQPIIDIVENYTISYRRVKGCIEAPSGIVTIDGSLRNYSLLGLEENITYNITIKAINHQNYLSATQTFTTKSAGT